MLNVHSVNCGWSLILIYNCLCFYVFIFHLIQTMVNYCMPKYSVTEIAECLKLNHSENNPNSPLCTILVQL